MKKIYRYILISVLGVMGMSSCVDNLLDRTPIASLSPTTFYQDENQCRMALMGVYSALQPVTSYDCIYNHRTTKTNQKYPSVNL